MQLADRDTAGVDVPVCSELRTLDSDEDGESDSASEDSNGSSESPDQEEGQRHSALLDPTRTSQTLATPETSTAKKSTAAATHSDQATCAVRQLVKRSQKQRLRRARPKENRGRAGGSGAAAAGRRTKKGGRNVKHFEDYF